MRSGEPLAFAAAVAGLVGAVSRRAPPAEGTVFRDCLASGSANAVASAILHPLDVVKTRMQVLVVGKKGSLRPLSAPCVARALYADGGLRGLLLPGLTASMAREMVGGSVRGGVYIPIRNALGGGGENGLGGSAACKGAAALFTGFIGGVISNPIEVVKIRLLADGNRYPSFLGAFPELVRSEGSQGCLRGLGPSVVRAAVINAGYLATYDHCKHTLLRWSGGQESPKYHILASLASGLAATTVAAPFDMIKTRVMASSQAGTVETLRQLMAQEGVRSLFRGWLPAYCRIGPHSLLCMPLQEEVRRLLGLGYI